MSNAATIYAGGRVVADDIRSVAPLSVVKGGDEPVTSNSTLQNDDALLLQLEADKTYFFILWLNYEGGTQGASDMKVGWSLPAGATIKGSASYVNSSGGSVVEVYFTNGTTLNVGTNGVGSIRGYTAKGTVVMGGTPGPLRLQWAQVTPNATSTIVHGGSCLDAWEQ